MTWAASTDVCLVRDLTPDDVRQHGGRLRSRCRRSTCTPWAQAALHRWLEWTAASGGAAQRGACRARRHTASAALSPPSPTPTWCWAASRAAGARRQHHARSRKGLARRWRRWPGAHRARCGRWPRASSRSRGTHDLRHPRDLDPARPRPARLHPDRLRRRRADARRRAGGRNRRRARPHPTPSWQLLRAWPARLRHQARRRAHARGPARRAGAAARGALRRDGSDGGAPARAGGLRSRGAAPAPLARPALSRPGLRAEHRVGPGSARRRPARRRRSSTASTRASTATKTARRPSRWSMRG